MEYLITHLLMKFFSKFDDKDNPKADMYLPFYILILGIASILLSIILAFISIKDNAISIAYVIGIPILLAGIYALAAYRYERINILSDDEFEYSKVFVKKNNLSFFRNSKN